MNDQTVALLSIDLRHYRSRSKIKGQGHMAD